VLKPDGFFLGSVLGGDTLFELRAACHAAEEERRGGLAPRTSPLMHVRPCLTMLRTVATAQRQCTS
jgi:NADH dehydrogenase [ubiquinone] 1 alpha subcomplex assembly factor 5